MDDDQLHHNGSSGSSPPHSAHSARSARLPASSLAARDPPPALDFPYCLFLLTENNNHSIIAWLHDYCHLHDGMVLMSEDLTWLTLRPSWSLFKEKCAIDTLPIYRGAACEDTTVWECVCACVCVQAEEPKCCNYHCFGFPTEPLFSDLAKTHFEALQQIQCS